MQGAQMSQQYAEGEDGQRHKDKRKGREEITMAIEQAKKYIIHNQFEDANKVVYETMSNTIK